jgi:hypothetical protein
MIPDRRSDDMLGRKEGDQLEFFIVGSLKQLIPGRARAGAGRSCA